MLPVLEQEILWKRRELLLQHCRFKKAQCNDSSLSVARNEKVCKRKLGGKNSLLSRIGGYRAFEVYED